VAETSTSRGIDGESRAMLEIATPDLYRVNAFRVLGLSVDVSSSDLSKQQKKMEMLEKLGEAAARAQQAILPLDPLPDADAIRKAGQQLRDPELRLIHELFWFWPARCADSDGDAAISLIRQGDLSGAHRRWAQLVEQGGNPRSVAAHNLAVLHHALALDMERAATSSKEQLGTKSTARRDKHWDLALRHWTIVVGDDAVWERVASRIREMDDPRLSAGLARRLRRALPAALLTISIKLAVSCAKRGDTDGARRHMAYIRNSGFDAGLAAALLDREVTPLVNGVKQMCESVPERSKADPRHADRLVNQLWAEVKPLLTIISALLDKRHHLREAACNVVAGTARNCIIDYGNATENWDRCAALLKQVVDIAADDGLRSRLQEDIAQVETNLRQEREYKALKSAVTGDQVYEVTLAKGSAYQELAHNLGLLTIPGEADGFRATVPVACVCCLGKPDAEQSVSHSWEETRGMTRYKRSLSFSFPLCRACSQHQSEYARKQWILVLSAAGGSIGMGYLIAPQMSGVAWLPFVLLGGLLTTTLLLVCSSFIRLSILSDEHASRDVAVEISSASDLHVAFRFHNPLYADAFAKANHATVKPHPYLKPPRGSYLLRGRAAIFVILASLISGGIGHSIIYASMQDGRKPSGAASRRDYSPRATENRRPSPPSDSYLPPRSSPPSYSYTGLAAKIESGKARVKLLEGAIEGMDSTLESLSTRISRYKQEIEGYEHQSRLGLNVNRSLYQRALDSHNTLVDQYNAMLTQRNAKYAEYTREIEAVNDMVRRYNSGER